MYFVQIYFMVVISVSACLREVKEIRTGKNSRDFDKWPEDSKKADSRVCFIVFFGSDFKLKTLSVVGEFDTLIDLFKKKCICSRNISYEYDVASITTLCLFTCLSVSSLLWTCAFLIKVLLQYCTCHVYHVKLWMSEVVKISFLYFVSLVSF